MKYLHSILLAIASLFTLTTLGKTSVMYESNALAQLLKEEMRHPDYAREVLPNNFTHVIQLLEYGTKTNQPRDYAQLVLRRFSNILKSAQYVNSHAALQMLSQFNSAIEPYISNHRYRAFLGDKLPNEFDTLERFNTCVTYHLYKKFSTEYDQFKDDPGSFLDALSIDIMHLAQEEVSIDQLRQTVYRFMEVTLSKLVWSPTEGLATWRNLKGMADNLATLVEINAIDNLEDLDDLYRTLVYRYCYFIDLMAPTLETEFYQTILHDLKVSNLIICETEDVDPCIETKRDVLQRTLMTGQAKRQTYVKQVSRS